VKPFFRVKASSWAAVAPASRMWYPETEIGCHLGMFPVEYSTMSVTSRIAGSTGKHHSFWAMYSFRMSVWMVPARAPGPTPWRSPTST